MIVLLTRCPLNLITVPTAASQRPKLLLATSGNVFRQTLSGLMNVGSHHRLPLLLTILTLYLSELLRQITLGMPMQRNASSYWQTNIWETTSGNFATPLLKFHKETLGLDRIMYSIDYPFVSRNTNHSVSN